MSLEASSVSRALSTVSAPLGPGAHHRPGGAPGADGGGRGLGGVHVSLLLSLHNVLLVADPLVAEPVAHLSWYLSFFWIDLRLITYLRH